MKNILLLFIVTFVVARVSTYYIDYNQEDFDEASIEKSNDWEDDNTDDYSSSYYMSPREMRDDEVRSVYEFDDSYEDDSIEYGQRYKDSNYEGPKKMVHGGTVFEPGINGGCSNIRFRCQRDSTCLHVMFVCDGVNDCSDGEDEWPSSCQKHTGSVTVKPIHHYPPPTSQPIYYYRPPTPQPIHYYPPPTSQLIKWSWCSTTEFHCQRDRKCIPLSYRCNKYLDCSDGEDEKFCTSILDTLPFRPGAMKTTTTTTTRPTSRKCRTYERRCGDYCRCLEYY